MPQTVIDGERAEATRKPWNAPQIILSEELRGTSKPRYTQDVYYSYTKPITQAGPS